MTDLLITHSALGGENTKRSSCSQIIHMVIRKREIYIYIHPTFLDGVLEEHVNKGLQDHTG